MSFSLGTFRFALATACVYSNEAAERHDPGVGFSDYVAIASLSRQLGYDATAALVQGEVVGYISLHALALFHASGYLGRITSAVVDERHKGRGIGRALIAAAQRWFEEVGCVKLEVASVDHRPDAYRFHERHGFIRDGQRLENGFSFAVRGRWGLRLSRGAVGCANLWFNSPREPYPQPRTAHYQRRSD